MSWRFITPKTNTINVINLDWKFNINLDLNYEEVYGISIKINDVDCCLSIRKSVERSRGYHNVTGFNVIVSLKLEQMLILDTVSVVFNLNFNSKIYSIEFELKKD